MIDCFCNIRYFDDIKNISTKKKVSWGDSLLRHVQHIYQKIKVFKVAHDKNTNSASIKITNHKNASIS